MHPVVDVAQRALFCLGTAIAITGLLRPALAPTVEFGVVDDELEFHATRAIVNAPGEDLTWRIAVDGDAPVLVREELQLPAAPRRWFVPDDVVIGDCGRSATATRWITPYDGFLEHSWHLTEGDPSGRYHLRLTLLSDSAVDGQDSATASVSFDVVDPG